MVKSECKFKGKSEFFFHQSLSDSVIGTVCQDFLPNDRSFSFQNKT